MSQQKGEIINQIQRILEQRRVHSYLAKPVIPEVLFNPDFLVVPSLGKLVTIKVQEIKQPQIGWTTTLALLEDLFEIKMATGGSTFCVLIILFHSPQFALVNDAVRLLSALYDQIVQIDVTNGEIASKLEGLFFDIIAADEDTRSRQSRDFWNREAALRHENYDRISKISYVESMLENVQKGQAQHQKQQDFRRTTVINLLMDYMKQRWVVHPNIKVENIKGYYLGQPYYFKFDFASTPSEFLYGDCLDRSLLGDFIEQGGALFKVLEVNPSPSVQKDQLRRLAMYARFISYRIEDANEQLLVPRTRPVSLFLPIIGVLSGPDFAPSRYLEMLISAGWTPGRPEDFMAFEEGGYEPEL